MARLTTVPVNMMVISTAPTAPAIRAGDLEYNVEAEMLRIWNGTEWVDIGQPVTSTLPDLSVTSSKFSVGGMTDNLLRNPGFEDLDGTTGFPLSWTLDATNNGTGTFGTVTAGDAIGGSRSLVLRASATKQQRIYQDMPTTPGDSFTLSAVVRVATGSTIADGFGLFVTWLDAASAVISSSQVNTFSVTTTATRHTTTLFTAPATAKFMRVIAMATVASATRDVQVDSLSLVRHSNALYDNGNRVYSASNPPPVVLTYGTAAQISSSRPGDVASAGTAAEVARADHRHDREPYGGSGTGTRAFGITMMGA